LEFKVKWEEFKEYGWEPVEIIEKSGMEILEEFLKEEHDKIKRLNSGNSRRIKIIDK
jgi:hypothetical protein